MSDKEKKEKCPLGCKYPKHIIQTTVPYVNNDGCVGTTLAYLAECCSQIFLAEQEGRVIQESGPGAFEVDEVEK